MTTVNKAGSLPHSVPAVGSCREFIRPPRLPLLSLAALLLATLACSRSATGPDINATVNAVATGVEQTVVAQTTFTPGLPPTETAASPLATDTSTPAPLPPTPTQFIPPTAPPPADVVRPNGSPSHAAHLATPPRLDGDLSEWMLFNFVNQATFRPENWTGPADASAAYAVAWDSQNLYLAAQVTDDKHVQTQHGEFIFQGDSLELLLDVDLRGDFTDAKLSGDDFQLGISPASLLAEPAEAYLWFPESRQGQPSGVTIAAKQSSSGEGYTLEAALPWTLFNITPAPNDRYGFVLSCNDNDNPTAAEQQTLVASVATRRLTNPTTWGTLILDP
jgi:hypothetical protein